MADLVLQRIGLFDLIYKFVLVIFFTFSFLLGTNIFAETYTIWCIFSLVLTLHLLAEILVYWRKQRMSNKLNTLKLNHTHVFVTQEKAKDIYFLQ